jgi:hypothetical protein
VSDTADNAALGMPVETLRRRLTYGERVETAIPPYHMNVSDVMVWLRRPADQ